MILLLLNEGLRVDLLWKRQGDSPEDCPGCLDGLIGNVPVEESEVFVEQVRHSTADDPKPSWLVHEYTPAGIVLRFFGWIDQHHSDLGKVRSEAIRVVKGAFAKAGIEAPRSTSHVILSREPGEADVGKPEPGPAHVDTSVNRDIDQQLAAAQRASDADNLLDGAAGADPAKPRRDPG